MKTSVSRQHEAVARAGTSAPSTSSRPKIEAARIESVLNPLWVITIGMGVFFAAAGALMIFGI